MFNESRSIRLTTGGDQEMTREAQGLDLIAAAKDLGPKIMTWREKKLVDLRYSTVD